MLSVGRAHAAAYDWPLTHPHGRQAAMAPVLVNSPTLFMIEKQIELCAPLFAKEGGRGEF